MTQCRFTLQDFSAYQGATEFVNPCWKILFDGAVILWLWRFQNEVTNTHFRIASLEIHHRATIRCGYFHHRQACAASDHIKFDLNVLVLYVLLKINPYLFKFVLRKCASKRGGNRNCHHPQNPSLHDSSPWPAFNGRCKQQFIDQSVFADSCGLEAPPAWAFTMPPPKRKYSAGTMNRLSRVDVTSPPRITTAIGNSISWPGKFP